MRISDWSSDVCSSDLHLSHARHLHDGKSEIYFGKRASVVRRQEPRTHGRPCDQYRRNGPLCRDRRADGGTRARRTARRWRRGAGARLMPQPDLLLIADDEAIAELIVWHFAPDGFSVRPTPDGEPAMITVEARATDLSLLH